MLPRGCLPVAIAFSLICACRTEDPVEESVSISGDANAVVTGELGHSLNLRCLAYGYPTPSIYWYRGLTMLPYSSEQYEARGNVLQIKKLDINTLGEYTCQAYNGVGTAALWSVLVHAYRPDADPHWDDSQLLVARASTTPALTAEASLSTAPASPAEIDVPVYTEPVNTSLGMTAQALATGSQLSLPCTVDGYPPPDVSWTKDGVQLEPGDRLHLTESRLTLTGLTAADSGVYGCHARNKYSSHSSTITVTVQDISLPANCTNNPYFANCGLIVRSKFCRHKYYSTFCCKSCVESGQLNPLELRLQADQPWTKK